MLKRRFASNVVLCILAKLLTFGSAAATSPLPLGLELGFKPLISEAVSPESAAIYPDGRIAVAGYFHMINGVLRKGIAVLKRDGTVDESFRPDPERFPSTFVMVLQPDGKLVTGSGPMERYNPDGSIDTTFNAGRGVSYSQARRPLWTLALQPDGKILAGGDFDYAQDYIQRPGIARFNSDGTLDKSFDPSRTAPNAFSPGPPPVMTLLSQSDGKFLAATSRFLVRVNEDGTLDPNFHAALPGPDYGIVHDIVVQPDGKIVLAGAFSDSTGMNRLYLARLNADGSSDMDFANALAPLTGEIPLARAVALQADGKVLVAGTIGNESEGDYPLRSGRLFLRRFHLDGQPDNTFQPPPLPPDEVRPLKSLKLRVLADGKIVFVSPPSRLAWYLGADGVLEKQVVLDAATPASVGLAGAQSDGKLVLHHTYYDGRGPGYAVLRLHPNGELDAGFDAGRKPQAAGLHELWTATLQPDGKLLLGGRRGAGAHVLRLNSDGSLDASFRMSSDLTNYGAPSVIVLQADGKILFGRTYLYRALSDGRRDPTFKSPFTGYVGVQSLIPLQDGKLLVGGFGLTDSFAVRLENDGTIDSSFRAASGGRIALQSTGKIIVLTRTGDVKRLNADGSEDLTFTANFDRTAPPIGNETLSERVSLFVDASGRIFLGGYRAAMWLSPDGIQDPYFRAVLGSTYYGPTMNSFAAGTSGSVYGAGVFASVNGQPIFSLARFVPAPQLLDARVTEGNAFSFRITNPNPNPFQVEVSSNLRDWFPAGPLTTNRSATFLDADWRRNGSRFYRARVR